MAGLTRALVSGLVVGVLLLSGGCGLIDQMTALSEPEEEPAAPPVTTDIDPIDPDWEPPLGEGPPALPSVAEVVARVKPSVVAIGFQVAGALLDEPITQEGGGSGWIIDDSGIVVTNAHVVRDAQSITVTLDDGRVIPVDMDTVAVDPQTDLAVLKIDADGLTALPVGGSDSLRLGDWVIAVGNSLGLGVRATLGIVSQNEVTINEELGQPLKLIETDAAINPGNSGGPLVNMAGEVIGINQAKIQQIDVEGVGWAIASTDALPIIRSLIKTGYVVRPFLGVGTRTVTPTIAFWYRLPVEEGVLITNVYPGSPADSAGLEEGDIVVSFDGATVTSQFDLVNRIHNAEIGASVEIVYRRGEARLTAEATLTQSPAPQR